MDNYCVIGKLKLVPIEGAKTLQLGYYGGLPFAVSKELTKDKLYLIFLPDGQISGEYANEHKLISYTDPQTGKREGGFFAKNCKVRSIKLMKGTIISVGYVAELDTLAFTGYDISRLKEGDSFSELNGVPIVRKFINEATRKAGRQNQQSKKRKLIGMAEHPDTEQLYKFVDTIEPGDLIDITYKLDGTSVRIGNAYEKRELKWYEKILNKIAPIQRVKNVHSAGTRRVVLNEAESSTAYYGSHSMYREVEKTLEGLLHPGESVYGEIVGYQDEQKPLFNRGGMIFKYGCLPGERKFFVYAITWTLPDGTSMQLPWSAVKNRCATLGIKHVTEATNTFIFGTNALGQYSHSELLANIQLLASGPEPLDNSHIKEGVVLRVTKSLDGSTKFFKYKTPEYYALEDASKNDESFVDVEEVQSQTEEIA